MKTPRKAHFHQENVTARLCNKGTWDISVLILKTFNNVGTFKIIQEKKNFFSERHNSQFKVLQLPIKSIWSLSCDDIFTQTPVLF